MTKREEIQQFVDTQLERHGLASLTDYKPTLGFDLTNNNINTDDYFKVDSLDEAQDLVISFISSAEKKDIFDNSRYDQSKDLYLQVKVILDQNDL